MISKFLASTLTIISLASNLVFADDAPRLGYPGYGGNGCPAGSASVTLSPDYSALSILFDSYMAEAGGNSYRTLDRKSCNIAIPVHVPQGYSVSLFRIDYRGFASIPQGGRGAFRAEYFWAGIRGPDFLVSRTEPYSGNFTLTDELEATSVVWSRCGQSITLRVNTSAEIATNQFNDQAMLTIDSADVSSGLIYHLQWKRCN